jgi:alpha-glucosidase
LTNEQARKLTQSLSFLASNTPYEAQIYRDGLGGDCRTNPQPVVIEHRTVTSKYTLSINMAPGGGTAIRLRCLR